MKELKRQAREQINDLVEKQCNPCTKQAELGVKDGAQFGRDYCNVQCAVGRDLKRLGNYLVKGESNVKLKEKKVEPTKEACNDLLAQGKSRAEIAEAFGISKATLYLRMKEWGLVSERKSSEIEVKKDSLQQIKEIRKEVAVDFGPDYNQGLKEVLQEIESLKYSNKMLTDQLKEKANIESYNRETYEELVIAQETIKDLRLMVRVANEETERLQGKYESLVTYTKAIM
jgi:transposase